MDWQLIFAHSIPGCDIFVLDLSLWHVRTGKEVCSKTVFISYNFYVSLAKSSCLVLFVQLKFFTSEPQYFFLYDFIFLWLFVPVRCTLVYSHVIHVFCCVMLCCICKQFLVTLQARHFLRQMFTGMAYHIDGFSPQRHTTLFWPIWFSWSCHFTWRTKRTFMANLYIFTKLKIVWQKYVTL